MQKKINIGSSREYDKNTLWKYNRLTSSPADDPNFFARKEIRGVNSSTSISTIATATSISTIAAATSSSTIAATTSPVTEIVSTNDTKPDKDPDSTFFLIIGLIVGITILGCILACLYRRRKIQKEKVNRSFRSVSVGTGTITRSPKIDGKKSSTSSINKYYPGNPSVTNGECVNIDLKEEALFKEMKLPPTSALPTPPTEARLPYATHYKSMSSPNVNIFDDKQITANLERTKSLGRNILEFNFPPPPKRPPNFSIPPHAITVNSATPGSECLIYTPTTPILNNFNDNGTSADDTNHLVSLPKVEMINKNLSINFEQLSIFKDRTKSDNEYPVGVENVGDRDNKNQIITKKDGENDIQVLVINNDDT
ncbi:16923_t:CDS:2, partial [Acaulospora colombiana]